MSNRTVASVLRAFADEAESAFNFLADEFGLAGPDRQALVLPGVAYVSPGLRYRILLDMSEQNVFTQVERDIDDGRLVGELAPLVLAAGLGSANRVAQRANNLRNLKHSLAAQAAFVRQLHPLLISSSGTDLLVKASARKWKN